MEQFLLHPKVVHLPIALAALMPLMGGGLVLAWWRGWLPPRAWLIAVLLQAMLVGSGLMAMRTGEVDEQRVEKVVAERFIEAHEEAAEVFVWAGAVVFAVMLVAAGRLRRRGSLAIALVAAIATVPVLVLAGRTGGAGGALVFEQGAANAFVGLAKEPPPAAVEAPPVGYDDDDDDDD